MGTSYNPGTTTNGLVMYYDLSNTKKSFLGQPTTNLIPDMSLGGMMGIGVSYLGVEDGWKKYSLSGTWASGTYPYSLTVSSCSFSQNVVYSTACYVKTNVLAKFEYFAAGMNYVNGSTNPAGNSFGVTQADESIYVGRSGFAYDTSPTSQVGYLLSKPLADGTVFNPATDFVYIKNGQIEQKAYCTPYTSGTRTATQSLKDLTGNITFDVTSTVFDGNGNIYFNNASKIFTNTTFPTLTSQISIECWCKPGSSQTTYADIWGNHSPNGMVLQQNASTLNQYSFAYWGSGAWQSSGYFNLTTSAWNHVVVTKASGGTVKVYVNNSIVSNSVLSGNIVPSPSANFMIGSGISDGTRLWNGEIQIVKVYDRTLTDDEVSQNFNALRVRYGI